LYFDLRKIYYEIKRVRLHPHLREWVRSTISKCLISRLGHSGIDWSEDCTTTITGCEVAEPPPESHSSEELEAKIADFVAAYFAQHPRAMDTAEGIVEWWMPPDRIRADPQTMKRVLDRLVEQGMIERVGTGEYAHYRLKS
jgi:hypothetical protein